MITLIVPPASTGSMGVRKFVAVSCLSTRVVPDFMSTGLAELSAPPRAVADSAMTVPAFSLKATSSWPLFERMSSVPTPVLVKKLPVDPPPAVCRQASPPAAPMVSVALRSTWNVPVLKLVPPVKEVVNLFLTFAATVSAVTSNVPPLKKTWPFRAANLSALLDAITPPLMVVGPV